MKEDILAHVALMNVALQCDFRLICSRVFCWVVFCSRSWFSIQDKVCLHEVQLWKQDPKLHEGGDIHFHRWILKCLAFQLTVQSTLFSVLRCSMPPKPSRRLKWRQSFWKHQSTWRRCWKQRTTMAATLIGLTRSHVACVLRKDGSPARYNGEYKTGMFYELRGKHAGHLLRWQSSGTWMFS